MRALALLLVVLAAPAAQIAVSARPSGHRAAGASKAQAAPPAAHAAAAQLSVATFNLNAGRDGNSATLDAAAALDTDLIMVQECSAEWAQALRERLGDRYPYAVFENQQQPYGASGVLSKLPIVGHQVLPRSAGGAFPALLVQVDVAGRHVTVLNVHLFPPTRLVKKMGWLRAYAKAQGTHRRELQAHLARLDQHPDVIVGDFNEDELGMGVRWLEEQGYALSLATRTNTWHWQTGHGEIRWPLDHVMVQHGVEVASAHVVHAGGSDHLPVVSHLRIQSTLAAASPAPPR